MSKTFAQLGIPFPLFEGSSDDASEYRGLATCTLCSRKRQHCFQLNIGCAVMCQCPNCGTVNGLDANDREDRPCRMCKANVSFPDLGEEILTACIGWRRATVV
jgi:hypothetical protein